MTILPFTFFVVKVLMESEASSPLPSTLESPNEILTGSEVVIFSVFFSQDKEEVSTRYPSLDSP
jgi:hypothetical protein